MADNKKENVITFEPSTIETVDMAMFEWLNENMDLHTTTNRGFKKVPVIWVSAERAYQSKRSKEMRDKEGALILAIDYPSNVQASQKIPQTIKVLHGLTSLPRFQMLRVAHSTITRQIKQDKTANFANADFKEEPLGRLTFQQRT